MEKESRPSDSLEESKSSDSSKEESKSTGSLKKESKPTDSLTEESIANSSSAKAPTKISTFDLIVTFLSPMLIGKSLTVYFGARYSAEPGEGYGYVLIACILFTLSSILRFLWKYRNYNDSAE